MLVLLLVLYGQPRRYPDVKWKFEVDLRCIASIIKLGTALGLIDRDGENAVRYFEELRFAITSLKSVLDWITLHIPGLFVSTSGHVYWNNHALEMERAELNG